MRSASTRVTRRNKSNLRRTTGQSVGGMRRAARLFTPLNRSAVVASAKLPITHPRIARDSCCVAWKSCYSTDMTSTAPTPPRAIGYVRVSTDQQADFGVSLEAQTAKIRAMAIVQGVALVDVIVDAGESAKSLRRPGMAQLRALVDAGAIETVIIAKLDRLTRSVADLA